MSTKPKAKAKRPRGAFANRIVGEGMADPATLKDNPANWRTHDQRQREAIREVLDSVGWVQRVIVNKTTGHLIDGHARRDEAVKRGEKRIPVLFVRLTAAEERRVLALFDPISAAAGVDKARLRAVLEGVSGDSAGLNAMIEDLRKRAAFETAEEEKPEVQFTEELLEEHNYVVLYFDNSVDWLHLQSVFPLAERKSLRSDGKFQQIGVGRVVRGIEFLKAMERRFGAKGKR